MYIMINKIICDMNFSMHIRMLRGRDSLFPLDWSSLILTSANWKKEKKCLAFYYVVTKVSTHGWQIVSTLWRLGFWHCFINFISIFGKNWSVDKILFHNDFNQSRWIKSLSFDSYNYNHKKLLSSSILINPWQIYKWC